MLSPPPSLSHLFVTLARLTLVVASFDLCQESGASDAFFTDGRGALSGNYEEVPCDEWIGYDGPELWNGGCLAGSSAGLWPSVGCGNTGKGVSLAYPAKGMAHIHTL